MEKGKSRGGIYPHKDGWGIRWKDAQGRDRTRTGYRTRAQAAAERKHLVGMAAVGEAEKPASLPTLAEYLKDYLATHISRHPRNNVLNARIWIEVAGSLPLDKIDVPMVRHLKTGWQKQGYRPATVNRRLAFLRRVLNVARHDGYELTNPVPMVGLVPENNERARELRPDEETRLEQVFDPWYWPYVIIAMDTSLRQGEQFALVWDNISFPDRSIYVPHTKPNRRKHVYMTERVYEALQQLWDRRQEGCPWVCPGREGGRLQVRNFLGRQWQPALERAGIEDMSWHDLRHTAASRLRRSGSDLSTIQRVLGQSTVRMAQRYTHVDDQDMRAAMQRLDGHNAKSGTKSGTTAQQQSGNQGRPASDAGGADTL